MTTKLALPVSSKITLEAGVSVIVAGNDLGDIIITVPNGTTVNTLEVTTATAADIQADEDCWVTEGSSLAGAVIHTVAQRVTAIRLTSTSGGTVYVMHAK